MEIKSDSMKKVENFFSPDILTNIHRCLNIFHEVLRVIKTETFNVDLDNKFIKFGLFCFFTFFMNIYVCVCVCKHIYVCINMYIYIYIYAYISVFM